MPEDLTEFLVATVIVIVIIIIIIIIIVIVVSIDKFQSGTDLRFDCSFLQTASRLLVH
jgi:L-asparagine transporter-like permease